MKKKSIIRVLKTINNICRSSTSCYWCVFKNNCPYSSSLMHESDSILLVAEVIKNTMDKEKYDNE